MKGEILITGLGAVTPIGGNVADYWSSLMAGRSGVRATSVFDASELPCRIAGEIKDFDPDLPRGLRKAPRFMRFANAAAAEALNSAGAGLLENPERVGLVMATAMAGITAIAEGQQKLDAGRGAKTSPHLVPLSLGNMAASQFAIAHGIKGPGLSIGTACSAGGDALMLGAMLLKSGMADAVLVMGGESILGRLAVSSLCQAKALSRSNHDPARACRPFDLERDGFVIGEGGGAIVLESSARARERGATPLAALAGYANTMDAHHITAPDPAGEGAAACMRKALSAAGLSPRDIGYINAHGTATLLGDRAEAKACRQVFGHDLPPMSSTKGATGHLMGAGGITEAIACVLALQNGILPPTINFSTPDPLCDFDCVPNAARPARAQFAMSNSMGFGGQNSSVILGMP